jgi:hypothetical protein
MGRIPPGYRFVALKKINFKFIRRLGPRTDQVLVSADGARISAADLFIADAHLPCWCKRDALLEVAPVQLPGINLTNVPFNQKLFQANFPTQSLDKCPSKFDLS